VRFAEIATGSVDGARRLQAVLSRPLVEKDFFPKVTDFPEGLTAAQFKDRYGERESAAYKRVIAEIDRRIAKIPMYR
jgi:hypothetical protein